MRVLFRIDAKRSAERKVMKMEVAKPEKMKKTFEFESKRNAILIGLGLTVVSIAAAVFWSHAFEALTGKPFNFDSQTSFQRMVRGIIGALPWIGLLAYIILGIRERRWTPPVFYSVGAVIPYILLVSSLFAYPVIKDHSSRIPFDSAVWKADENRNTGIRVKMVNNLLKTRQVVGSRKAEIDSLLGVPQSTGYFKDFEYVYWLGPERGFFSIDSEWLCLNFRDGVVSEAEIRRD